MKKLGFVAISLLVTSFLTSCVEKKIKIYTVTFDTDGGSIVEPIEVKENHCLTKPNDPVKEPLTTIEYTFKEWQLDGKPFDFDTKITSDITLKAIWSESTRLYTVSFNSDGGTPVNPIKTEYNTIITPPDNPSKESTAEFSYDFNEWQLDGEPFDFDTTPIIEDITLKADWTEITRQYTVYFDSAGGSKVSPITTDYNTTIDPPDNPTYSDDVWIYDFAGWFKEDGGEFDFDTPITGDITLTAKWIPGTRKTYKVKATNANHLAFTTMEGQDLNNQSFEAGKDFRFKIKAINDSNDSRYVIPTTLDIRVKSEESKPIVDGYVINPESDHTGATVVIYAEKVVGNIFVSGAAVLEGNYHYDVPFVYGLENIASGEVTNLEQDLVLTFTPIEKYQRPKAENIYIKFDNVEEEEDKTKWISPNDEDVEEEYCSYDPDSGQLTIKSKHIRNNILVVARAHDFKLLNSLDWDDINEIAFAGLAPLAFYIGEEKEINLKDQEGLSTQNFKHSIRIIGFNHDKLNGSTTEEPKYAKITFEFANVITNQYSVPSLLWNTKKTPDFANPTSFDYPKSTLNDYLNNDIGEISIYSRLPDDLRKYVKTVDKNVMISTSRGETWDEHEYKTKLFPLSAIEMSRQIPSCASTKEGITYQYYLEHEEDENRFEKTTAPGGGAVLPEPHSYWIRSPYCTSYSDNAFCIYYDDKEPNIFAHSYVYNQRLEYSVAPAFCI